MLAATFMGEDEPAQNPASFALLAWGLILLGVALLLFLTGIGQISLDATAPPWVLIMVALPLALGGAWALSAALAPPGRPWLATATALVFFSTLAILFTWLTLTGAEIGDASFSIGPISLPLPRPVARVVGRVVLVVATLAFDALTIVVWVYTLRRAARPRPSP